MGWLSDVSFVVRQLRHSCRCCLAQPSHSSMTASFRQALSIPAQQQRRTCYGAYQQWPKAAPDTGNASSGNQQQQQFPHLHLHRMSGLENPAAPKYRSVRDVLTLAVQSCLAKPRSLPAVVAGRRRRSSNRAPCMVSVQHFGSSPAGGSETAGSSSGSKWPKGAMVVPMPKLSHEMGDGVVAKWHVAEGQRFSQYDVILEVATDSLTEKAYQVGDFEGTVTLLVESQEEGVVGKLLAPEGTRLPAGAPAAIVYDADEFDEDDTLRASDSKTSAGIAVSCPSSNVYDAQQPHVRVLEWQSFLKQRNSGDNRSGCMG